MAKTLFGPRIKVADGIDNSSAKFAINRACAIAAMFFEGARGQAEMNGGVGRSEKAGNDRCWNGIHGYAPVMTETNGERPQVISIHGAWSKCEGSDIQQAGQMVTPCALDSTAAKEVAIAAIFQRPGLADQAPAVSVLGRTLPSGPR